MPVDSEYAIYIASQEYSVLSAIQDIPPERRQEVINLARSSFRSTTDTTSRAKILRNMVQRINLG